MPSNALRLPTDWLAVDDPSIDPWTLSGTAPDAGWRDACIGNGLIGQRIGPRADGTDYHRRSGSFRAGLWGGSRENPQRPEGLIELPNWSQLRVDDGEADLRRSQVASQSYEQSLDLRTATVHTQEVQEGSLGQLEIDRRTWLCRHVPQLGVVELTVRRPQGGLVGIEEQIDVLDWSDLADSSTAVIDDDIQLLATSSTHGHQVAVRSHWLVEAPGEPGKDGLVERPTTNRLAQHTSSIWRRREWRLLPGEQLKIIKLVAITTDLDSDDPAELAKQLIDQHSDHVDDLRQGHETAWAALWQSRIEVPHRKLQQIIHVSWYHHLIALDESGQFSHGPCALSGNGWDGLVFWDTDTWTLPVYAMLAPKLAKGPVAYRHRTLPGARANAERWHESGARWPWMSAETGHECCSIPTFQNERHVVSCVALAQWTYACCAGDWDWLKHEGREVVVGCAEYWASKVTPNDDGSYSINGVCGSDEDAGIVDDNATTNYGAAWTLRLATRLQQEAGEDAPEAWTTIADGLRILWDDERNIPKQMASWQHGQTIKQADTSMMVYPWQYPFDDDTARRLVDYYREHYPEHPIMMGRAIDGVVDCQLARPEKAWDELNHLCAHMTLPFLTATEDPVNERLPFLTGYGGILQLILAGFAGIRVQESSFAITPASSCSSTMDENSWSA